METDLLRKPLHYDSASAAALDPRAALPPRRDRRAARHRGHAGLTGLRLRPLAGLVAAGGC